MTTYEYMCEECKHEWEEVQKMTDPATTTCPKCKKEKAIRLISGGLGFQLLGGGWANTGYS